MKDYGYSLRKLKRLDQACVNDHLCWQLQRKVSGELHPETLNCLRNYAKSLEMAGRIKESLPYLRYACILLEFSSGKDHPRLIDAQKVYASALQKEGDFQA